MAMAEIKVKENETIDSALRRFKRSYLKSGVQAGRMPAFFSPMHSGADRGVLPRRLWNR